MLFGMCRMWRKKGDRMVALFIQKLRNTLST
jgi:hypothetical protein